MAQTEKIMFQNVAYRPANMAFLSGPNRPPPGPICQNLGEGVITPLPPGSDSHDYLFLSSITIKTNLVIGLFSILGMDVLIWLIEEEKLTSMVDQTMYSSLFSMCIQLVLS